MSKTNQHGGARKGAGKPAQFEKPMKRKEVMLPDEAIEFFLALGNGNLSAGVRQAWRSLTKRAVDNGVDISVNLPASNAKLL
mgnify:CR=1 FL=1